jgi:DNA modification methylase
MATTRKKKARTEPKSNIDPTWPASEIVQRAVADLIPYANNSRTHDAKQIKQLVASIKEWGWTNPVLIDEEGGIIAGHGRVMAAENLGAEVVPCVVAKGWSEAQKKAYVLADNQLALNAGWDRDLLKIEVGGLAEMDFDLDLIGFSGLEMTGLLQDETELEEDDEANGLLKNPVSKTGDLWILGDHRLLCGDATAEADVELLLAGQTPLLMVTDPPYGVNYDPNWREGLANSDGSKLRSGKVTNDDRSDWTEAYKLFPGSVVYVWHAGLQAHEFYSSIQAAGFEVRAQIIWDKTYMVISRGSYHWRHEPCWYAVRKGQSSKWIGDRKQSTVWPIKPTDDGDENNHSTQKPIECMGKPMRNHDAAQVYDPFCGSGSTLIAAELLGRQCFAMELEPGYVDVIVQRWQDRTKQEARLETGATFFETSTERLG